MYFYLIKFNENILIIRKKNGSNELNYGGTIFCDKVIFMQNTINCHFIKCHYNNYYDYNLTMWS